MSSPLPPSHSSSQIELVSQAAPPGRVSKDVPAGEPAARAHGDRRPAAQPQPHPLSPSHTIARHAYLLGGLGLMTFAACGLYTTSAGLQTPSTVCFNGDALVSPRPIAAGMAVANSVLLTAGTAAFGVAHGYHNYIAPRRRQRVRQD